MDNNADNPKEFSEPNLSQAFILDERCDTRCETRYKEKPDGKCYAGVIVFREGAETVIISGSGYAFETKEDAMRVASKYVDDVHRKFNQHRCENSS